MATTSEMDGLLEEFIEAFNMTEQRTRKEVVAKRLAKLKWMGNEAISILHD